MKVYIKQNIFFMLKSKYARNNFLLLFYTINLFLVFFILYLYLYKIY